MANHKSARKKDKQDVERTMRNRATLSRIRTFIKKVLEAVSARDSATAVSCMRSTESEIMKAARKNVLKLNSAIRKVSSLSRKVKSIVDDKC